MQQGLNSSSIHLCNIYLVHLFNTSFEKYSDEYKQV